MVRVLHHAVGAGAWLAKIALVMMALHLVAEIVLRRVLTMPLPGTIEIVSYYYLPALVFLYLARLEEHDRQIRVELVTSRLSRRVAHCVARAGAAASCAYFAAIAIGAAGIARDKLAIGEFVEAIVSIAIWPARFLLPIGAALATLVLLAIALRGRKAHDASGAERR